MGCWLLGIQVDTEQVSPEVLEWRKLKVKFPALAPLKKWDEESRQLLDPRRQFEPLVKNPKSAFSRHRRGVLGPYLVIDIALNRGSVFGTRNGFGIWPDRATLGNFGGIEPGRITFWRRYRYSDRVVFRLYCIPDDVMKERRAMYEDRICRFPKHEGKLWEDILEEDREYIDWLVSGDGPEIDSDLYDYLMELLEDA